MAEGHWLVKTEPGEFSFADLRRKRVACWDGVRNALARNYLRAMREGERVLVYHSVVGKEVVGIARVHRSAYPDPTSTDERWLAVDLLAERELDRPVTLAEIKADRSLGDLLLVRMSRLSVMPVAKRAFDRIVKLGTSAR